MMSFRIRIMLYVVAGLGAVLAGVFAALVARERSQDEEHADRVLSLQSVFWESRVQNRESWPRQSYETLYNGRLAAALSGAAPDAAAIETVVGELFDRLATTSGVSLIEVLDAGIEVAYSTELSTAPFSEPIVAPWLLRKAVKDGIGVHGVSRLRGGRIALVTGLPVRAGDGNVGVVVLVQGLDELLRDFSASLEVVAMVLGPQGDILAASRGADTALAANLDIGDSREARLRVIDWEERSLAVSTIPLSDIGGGRLGHLAIFQDVTLQDSRDRIYRDALIAATLLFAVIVLIALYGSIRHGFLRLDEVIVVLNGLARGETALTLMAPKGNDEIGRLGQAVEQFRQNALALSRVAKGRVRRQRRQERFIASQMRNLAEGLGGQFGQTLQAELAQITSFHAEKQTNQTSGASPEVLAGDSDELGVIADAFEHMVARVRSQYEELSRLVIELREALVHKSQLASLQNELDIARKIQTSILPTNLSEPNRFEVCGTMQAAKEVGGDFYDFFLIDENRLGVVVADVSGKGVPAAFFMLISRTLLKATATFGLKPADVLTKLNDLLSVENEQMMFVTMFYGILDLDSGAFTYSNGGHNSPGLLHGGDVGTLDMTGDMALAVMENLTFSEGAVQLAPGDTVVLFTDGVTEAFDPAENMYGDDRLMETLAATSDDSAPAILEGLMNSVVTFAADAPQADDITIVALRYLA